MMAGVVGVEPTVQWIKTRGYCYQELSGKSRKLLSKIDLWFRLSIN